MNEEEERILHGLYSNLGVGNAVVIRAGEVYWLSQTAIPGGRKWRKEGEGFKSAALKVGDVWSNASATENAVDRWLQYLEQAGYITLGGNGNKAHISVTAQGANLARELDSRFGRLNLFYKRHKDGVLGLVLTIAVSILTSFLTTEFIGKGKESEPPAAQSNLPLLPAAQQKRGDH